MVPSQKLIKIKKMRKIEAKICLATSYDVLFIMDLQIKNHFSYLAHEERKEGFVTLLTSSDYLNRISSESKILIARHSEESEFYGLPIGYLIWIDSKSVYDHNILKFFCKSIEKDGFSNFVNIAQVAIDRRYVGQHRQIGSQLYEFFFKKVLIFAKYNYCIAVLNSGNIASINFHKKFGFEESCGGQNSFYNEFVIMYKKLKDKQ
jgi:predicted GNAT superfamily acetyltransferase